MVRKELVIAIDGPAASGKSTTAKMVARHFGYTYVDTGAMYRAVTLAALRAGIAIDDRAAVEEVARRVEVDLVPNGHGLGVLLDGEEVTGEIRSPEVTASVSRVSAYPGVREEMVEMQRRLGRAGGIVMDGRDIGTVVFPDADLKIFMVADLHARAERRQAELRSMGSQTSVDGVEQLLAERDRLDSSRDVSPLAAAPDAIHIDTSTMTIDQQVARVIELAEHIRSGGDSSSW